jgi:hypothetical protein
VPTHARMLSRPGSSQIICKYVCMYTCIYIYIYIYIHTHLVFMYGDNQVQEILKTNSMNPVHAVCVYMVTVTCMLMSGELHNKYNKSLVEAVRPSYVS